MNRERGIGTIAAMAAPIGAMTWVRTLRWPELGAVDRAMTVVLWIFVTAAVIVLGATAWRYWRMRREHFRREKRADSNNAPGC